MAERLQLRRDTAAQWEAVNPILRVCEIGLVVDLAGRVTGMKIGDGRVWNALPLIPIAEKVGTSMIADGSVTSEKIAEGVLPTKVSQLTNDTILQVHHGVLDIVNKVYTVFDLSSPIGWTTINRGPGLPESQPISMLDSENIAVYDHDVYYIIDRASMEVIEEQPNYSDVYATKQYVKSLEDRIAALES